MGTGDVRDEEYHQQRHRFVGCRTTSIGREKKAQTAQIAVYATLTMHHATSEERRQTWDLCDRLGASCDRAIPSCHLIDEVPGKNDGEAVLVLLVAQPVSASLQQCNHLVVTSVYIANNNNLPLHESVQPSKVSGGKIALLSWFMVQRFGKCYEVERGLRTTGVIDLNV